jgi:hypothetical protein
MRTTGFGLVGMKTRKQRLLVGHNKAVLRIQIRMFFDLLDPDPDQDPDPSIIKKKKNSKKNLDSYCFVTFYDFLSL